MKVTRISTRGGSYIEPPLDNRWPKLTQLEWKAACVTADTGIELDVAEADLRVNGRRRRGYYDVTGPGTVHGCAGFNDTWSFLTGIEAGIRMAKKAIHEEVR